MLKINVYYDKIKILIIRVICLNIIQAIKNNKTFKRIFYLLNSFKLRNKVKNNKPIKLDEYTHYNLYSVKAYSKEEYNNIAQAVHSQAIKNISVTPEIKVAFVVYSAEMWSCEKLYTLFESDPRFSPFIIICKMKVNNAQVEDETYDAAVRFFTTEGYRIIETQSEKSNISDDCTNPDIFIYLTPYSGSLIPSCFDISKVKLDKLCVYIPYSFIVSDNEKLLENGVLNLSWKFFCESKSYLELMKKKSTLGGSNTFFTGFPGLDCLIEGTDKGIFKNAENKKKIIYAPHFSIGEHGIGFSTFDKNYRFMLDLARETSDSISWVIKPHPRLKAESIACGLFENEEAYDNYINEWNSLKNAKAVLHGKYNDLFAESDAMILDSASFLIEYQFTGNPLLFLTNERQRFNSFGDRVMKTVYKADGNDFEAIRSFVINSVINSQDILKKERKRFFDSELNYIEQNGGLTASEKIYQLIRSEFTDEY